jgi:TetR/AcrR family transcriptional regulator, transcriptional repressor for nem operon
LIFLRLYAEETVANAEHIPGCLVATITYQERSFAHDVREANVAMLQDWRGHIRGWLDAIVRDRRPNDEPDLDALTDAAWATVLGAFTVAKTVGRTEIIGEQILLYRETIKRIFPDR